jgi:redox-sensitive bicupin YhaK (pirin superfamily)
LGRKRPPCADRHSAGASLSLPAPQAPGVIRLLYTFTGEIRIGDVTLGEGESVILDASEGTVQAQSESDLVLFTRDAGTPVFKGGMFSGSVLAA